MKLHLFLPIILLTACSSHQGIQAPKLDRPLTSGEATYYSGITLECSRLADTDAQTKCIDSVETMREYGFQRAENNEWIYSCPAGTRLSENTGSIGSVPWCEPLQ